MVVQLVVVGFELHGVGFSHKGYFVMLFLGMIEVVYIKGLQSQSCSVVHSSKHKADNTHAPPSNQKPHQTSNQHRISSLLHQRPRLISILLAPTNRSSIRQRSIQKNCTRAINHCHIHQCFIQSLIRPIAHQRIQDLRISRLVLTTALLPCRTHANHRFRLVRALRRRRIRRTAVHECVWVRIGI